MPARYHEKKRWLAELTDSSFDIATMQNIDEVFRCFDATLGECNLLSHYSSIEDNFSRLQNRLLELYRLAVHQGVHAVKAKLETVIP
jgi:hypothetical protein